MIVIKRFVFVVASGSMTVTEHMLFFGCYNTSMANTIKRGAFMHKRVCVSHPVRLKVVFQIQIPSYRKPWTSNTALPITPTRQVMPVATVRRHGSPSPSNPIFGFITTLSFLFSNDFKLINANIVTVLMGFCLMFSRLWVMEVWSSRVVDTKWWTRRHD